MSPEFNATRNIIVCNWITVTLAYNNQTAMQSFRVIGPNHLIADYSVSAFTAYILELSRHTWTEP